MEMGIWGMAATTTIWEEAEVDFITTTIICSKEEDRRVRICDSR